MKEMLKKIQESFVEKLSTRHTEYAADVVDIFWEVMDEAEKELDEKAL